MSELALPVVERKGRRYIDWLGRLVAMDGKPKAHKRSSKPWPGWTTEPEAMRSLCEAVAREHSISLDSLLGTSQLHKNTLARRQAMYLMHEIFPEMSGAAIGRAFRRHHTTLMIGIRQVEWHARTDGGKTALQLRRIRVGIGRAPVPPTLTPLSESALRARRPASPASLLDASQDRPITPAKARVAAAVRVPRTD